MLLFIILILTIVFFVYNYFNKYDYWKKRGVSNPKPVPFLGNMKTLLLQQEGPVPFISKIYKKYEDKPYVGIYKIGQPALILRDPELIKNVIIKDFSHFQDNDLYITESDLFSQNPFILKGEKWKIARAQLTPALTQVKIKSMFNLVENISNKLLGFIKDQGLEEDVEGKMLCTRFTTDNFTSCAFGIDGKSFENPREYDLFTIGNLLLQNSIWLSFYDFCIFMKPAWSKIFKPKFFSKEILSYFKNAVSEMNKYRSTNNIFRNDFFDFMNAAVQKVHSDKSVQEEQLAVHCLTLYIDGVETSGITMAFVLYELAKHSEIQDKLRAEIMDMLEANDNTWNYEALSKCDYLDSVISESLRLHPPIPHMTRLCTKTYTLPITDRNPKELTIEAGTPVIIPITSLHYDEQFYPNPNEYDPERFRDGIKLDVPKCTYMPFGEGPRICIGRRYGKLQVQLGVAKILSKFKISISKKTQVPLMYENQFLLLPIGGLWLRFGKL